MLGDLKGAFDAPVGSPSPVAPVTYRSFDDVRGQRDAIYSNALRGVRSLKPVENEKYRVEIADPDYAQDYNPSLSDEKKALMSRQSMQRAIKGRVRLIDKSSGQVVDETETTLAHVPHLTPRGIFVRGGTIWAAKNQQRLRPGVYVLRQQNGDVKAQVNPKPGSGRGFDIQLEPATGVFKLNVGQSGTRLYPLLRSMGVPDETIKEVWGDDLFKANWRPPGGHDAQEARKIVAKMGRRGDQDTATELLKDKLQEILGRAELDEETTETTLGTKYKNFNLDTMLNATAKMLKRSRDEVPDDVRDSQAFQSFHGPEDFFEERLSRGSDAMRKLLWRATRDGNLGNVSPGLLNPAVDSVFQSGLMSSVEDTNPMEIMDARQTITRLGEGGISSNQAVPRSARGVQPSYFGLIDPIRAPEGQNIGVDMRVTDGALKGSDGRLYFKVRSRKGEEVTLSAIQASKKPIAFPGEFARAAKRELYKVPLMGSNGKYEDHVVDMNDIATDPEISASVGTHGLGKPLPPMVRVLDGEDIRWKPASEVDYELPHGSSLFSRLTNMVPMTQGAKSQRTLMGARMSVTGDTPVLIRRENGEHYYGPIEDYEHVEGDCAVSVDKCTSKVTWRRVHALDKHLNVKRVKKVTLKSGRHMKATDDHSFVTIGEDGGLTKVHTQDLTKGMPVPIVAKIPDSVCDRTEWVITAGRKHNAYPAVALPLNFDTGWVHGMYIAEGSLSYAHKNGHKGFASAVSFANCDSDVLNKLFEYFRNIGVNAAVLSGRADGKLDRVNVCWAQFASAISSDYGARAYSKEIPGWVFFAPLEFRRGLLAGYLAGDGGVQRRRDAVRVNGSSRSGKLIDGFVNLCATMGIMCNRSATHVMTGPGGSHAIQHYFEVRTEHISRLPTLYCERKDLRIRTARWSGKKSADWFPRWPKLDTILRAHTHRGSREYKRIYSNQLTRESVRTLLGEDAASIAWLDSDVWWDRIESVEELDAKQYTYVYDLDMEDNVFMCGACVVVHNTSQALPLQNPEAPLVQAANPDGTSIHDSMGTWMGAVKARAPGRVVAVTPDHIDVVYAGGKKERHELYNNYPLARKTSLHNTPLVREGDSFKPGDVLAKSNFTDDRGHATMGANFRVGYMVGKGSVSGDTNVLIYRNGATLFGPIRDAVDTSEITDDKALALNMQTITPEISTMSRGWRHPADGVLHLEFSDGRRLKATKEHSFVVFDYASGDLVETNGAGLVVERSVVPRLGSVTLPVITSSVQVGGATLPLDFDFGFICGVYASEGWSIGEWGSAVKGLGIAISDPVLRAAVCSKFKSVFGGQVISISDKPNTRYIHVWGSAVGQWFIANIGEGAAGKMVPSVAFGAPEDYRHGFIAGMVAGDFRVSASKGKVPKDIDLITTSVVLRDGLGLLMASVGIRTTHGHYELEGYTRGAVYRLGVCLSDLSKIREFPHSSKSAKVQELSRLVRRPGRGDWVPLSDRASAAYLRLTSQVTHPTEYSRIAYHCRVRRAQRSDVLAMIPENTDNPDLRRLRELAESTVQWASLKSSEFVGQPQNVYDLEICPTQTFVCVDTLVVHNSTYEDGFVISESAARRLSSQHAYKHELELDKNIHSTKKADYSAIFQGKYKPEQISGIDDDGVIKEGTIVQPGDPVLLAVRKKTPRPGGVVTPSARSAFADASQTWDHSTPGQVTDVVRTRKGIKVTISSVEPMTEGSKLTARYGNKGVVSQIVPDGEMPVGADGKPLDVIVNALGVISRANPSVLAETLLGKVAQKTGKPYVLKSFDHDDLGDFALNEAKANGVNELDDVTDPKTGRKIKGVFTGVQHLMRLHHTAESGLAARDTGGYTSDDSPAKGGPEGSKKIALLGVQCLLSAGATNVLKDAKLIRGQRNDDYWRAVKLGMDPVMPAASGAHGHFLSLLKGAGVNVRENQGRLKLAPMTDADTDALAQHTVSTSETFDFETMQPKDGGLFDLAKTGGADGRHFTKIVLPQKIPNPVMEEPIIRILGLTKQRFLDVLSGQEKIGDKTGPEAIETALKGINVEREIAMHIHGVKTGSKSSRDVHVRALNYLSGLKSAGVEPGDLMISKIPVIPPKFRPVIRAGKMDIIHDANYLYHDLMESGKNYTEAQKTFGDAGEEYGAMYAAAKAVVGLGTPINPKHVEQGVKGLLQNAIGIGDSPKFARFQRKVLGQAVDTVGRGVATPDPELDMDQVSIPKDMAWIIYRPYVIRRLVRSGWSAREAVMAVREQKPAAFRELQNEMKTRPVYWDRAPALQRYNYVGAWPVLSRGNNIGVPQVVEPGANLDFDGDKINLHVPSHHDAVRDVIEKMMPSKNLWHPADFDVHLKPDKDYLAGLYLATSVKKDKPPRTFASKEDAYQAYLRGDLGVADPVVILSSHNPS